MSERLDSSDAQVWRHYVSEALGVMAGEFNLTVEEAVARIRGLRSREVAWDGRDADRPFLEHVPDPSKFVYPDA